MAYSKEVVDRFEGVLNSPKQFSVGRFDPKDPTVATGMTGAPACGDVMKLQLRIDPGNNRISCFLRIKRLRTVHHVMNYELFS